MTDPSQMPEGDLHVLDPADVPEEDIEVHPEDLANLPEVTHADDDELDDEDEEATR